MLPEGRGCPIFFYEKREDHWRGVLRFNQIQRLKPNLSPRILTAQLRELEQDGVIVRKVYPVVRPKVEYSLSKAGESLKPLIKAMQDWGDEYLLRTNAPISSRAKAAAQRNEERDRRKILGPSRGQE